MMFSEVGTYPNVTLFDVPYIGLLDESAYGLRRIGGVYLMPRRIRLATRTMYARAHTLTRAYKEGKLRDTSNRALQLD